VATARADELTRVELRAGAVELGELVARERPRVVAVLGLTAYRTAFDQPKASAGCSCMVLAVMLGASR